MPAQAELKGVTHVFPDAAKVDVVSGQGPGSQLIFLRKENDQVIAYIRLGEGDYVTVGQKPQIAPD
jgi:hypothetical protein